MRKTSKILFLVGGILAIFLAILWLIAGIFLLVDAGAAITYRAGGTLDPQVVSILEEMMIKTGMTINEIIALFLTTGIASIVFFIFSVPAAVLSFICHGKARPGLALLIVSTIIGFLGGSLASVAGGILGFIVAVKEND